MIITALKLQDATQDGVMNPLVMDAARMLFQTRNDDEDNFAKNLFEYSALLASIVATQVSSILLTETEMEEMVSQIKEFDKISRDVLGE